MTPSGRASGSEGERRALGCLARISARVNSTEDPAEALGHILDEIVDTLRASSASIALIEPATGALRIEVSRGLGEAAATQLQMGQGITGWVAVHARPLRVSDVQTEPRYRMLRPSVRSELAVPMEILGQVVGVVNCDSDRLDAFSVADEELLTLVTAEAAKAVGRLWMLGQLRSKTRQLESILGAGQELVRDRDEPGIAADLARHARKLLGLRAAAFYSIEQGGLVLLAKDGDLGESVLSPRLASADSAMGTVAARGRPVEVSSAGKGEEQLFTVLRPDIAASSLLLLPVAHEQESFAVLAGLADGQRRFSDDERRVLGTVVSYAALALRNVRLYAKAFAAESELRKGERLTALGMLSAEIAHEIRNPLTVMRLLTDTIGNGLPEGDPRREDLEVMRDKVAHMEGVVSRVLSLARSQSGAFRPLDLAALARQTSLMLRLKLEQKGALMSIESPENLPEVAGDAGQIQQVFLNLILNSLQAMPSGGDLSVVLSVDDVSGSPVVVVRITDTGGGIPGEVLPRIFDSFFTGREDGTGLGLAIVKRILRAHRGDVTVDATGPAGTVFRFWIPLSE
jgi:signal transduction histidine kinase